MASLDIAARVTTGAPWPCHTERREPGNVMLMSAEDDSDDTICPRLAAAGADLSRVRIISGVRGERGEVDWLALDRHFKELAEGLRAFGPRLLVIDPLSSYMGRADTNHEGDSRKVLAGLAELAKQTRTAVLAVRHFRKGAADSPQGRVIGSVAFTAAARAVYGVVPDPEDGEWRLVVCLKCNLARDTLGYRFRIESTVVGDPVIRWDAEHEYRGADELLGGGGGTLMTCEACGAGFLARRKDSSFCSTACKQKAYRERTKSGVTDPTDSNSRNDPSRKVTRYGSLPFVTAIRDTHIRNATVPDSPGPTLDGPGIVSQEGGTPANTDSPISTIGGLKETAVQPLVRSHGYSMACLNCDGRGCRWCDAQIRAQEDKP